MGAHGQARVGTQIHHDLVDLNRIALDPGHGRAFLPDTDGGWQAGTQQLEGFLDDTDGLDGLGFHVRSAAEGKNLANQLGRPDASVLDVFHQG